MMSDQSLPTDFVFVGIQSWDLSFGGNAKDMAHELSKTGRVLYINPPLDRITTFRKRKLLRPQERPHPVGYLRQVTNTLWVLYPRVTLESINWLPDSFVYDYLNRLNNQRLARSIRWGMNQLAFGRFTLFNDSDMIRSFYLKEMLAPQRHVYYTRDNLMAVDYWKKHGHRLESGLMQKVDLVVSNSAYLARLANQHNPHAVDIGQGCDFTQFDALTNHSLPNDLKSIAYPRIGYIGSLNASRLDINWLLSVAQHCSDWNVLLIGPQDDTFQKSSLHSLANVHFLGAKLMEELPAYVQHLDVAINPQQLNELTIGNYPRKVDEYLAMGKPVVARQTETMRFFSDYVILAETCEQFIAGIEKVLNNELSASSEACIEFAHQHTWAQSVAKLVEALERVSPRRFVPVNSL